MQIPLNYYTVSLLIGGFTAIISGFVVMIHDHRRSENQAWFALTMSTAVWSFGYFYMTIAPTHNSGLLGNWILHYAAIFIPLFYYLVVLIITDTFSSHKIKFITFTTVAFLFTAINLTTYFVKDVVPKVGFNYAPVPGPLYICFFIYFVWVVADGLVTSGLIALRTPDRALRTRLLYTIIFTIAAALGGGSVFATTFLTIIPPYLLILFSIYPAISGYAILRYQLFDVKVVTAQIFTFTLWIFIFVRILMSESTHEQLNNVALLVITIILGMFLNRSVNKEVSQRERIEKLAEDLEAANKGQQEFLHFLSHEVKGYFSVVGALYDAVLTDPDYGPISDNLRSLISTGMNRNKKAVIDIEDILVSADLKNGSVAYNIEDLDFKAGVSDLCKELKPEADDKGIEFRFVAEEGKDFTIKADKRHFIGHAIRNLIENSIIYTLKGEVMVSLSRHDGKIKLAVSDTGVGLSPEDKAKLFTEGGKGAESSKVNAHSTGHGLYIAKRIIEAHKGKVWAESEGRGKGSIFFVEMRAEK